jgi:SAM-dependent methyltransferase
MSGSRETVPAAYFEQLYRSDPDPWRFESSAYERAKYLTTLAALPRRRYRRACEIGCANGVLTRQLAARCDELLAIDVADTALARATARTVDQPWVRCERLAVPEAFPTGPFDLVLLSEVGYYLASEALCDLRARLDAAQRRSRADRRRRARNLARRRRAVSPHRGRPRAGLSARCAAVAGVSTDAGACDGPKPALNSIRITPRETGVPRPRSSGVTLLLGLRC